MCKSVIICDFCKKEFERENGQINQTKRNGTRSFCSRSCSSYWYKEDSIRIASGKTEKKCIICKEVKLLNEFHICNTSRDGKTNRCKKCNRNNGLEWENKNRNKIAAHRKEKLYGLTPEMEAEIIKKQNGVCAICHSNRKLYVDHCHKTGVIRGLLCNRCNRGLGVFGDDQKGIRKALNYLVRSEIKEGIFI